MKLNRLAVLLAVAAAITVPASPAAASCAGQPVVSAYAFASTVLYTTQAGRIARVLTDNAHLVTVSGSTDLSVITPVDRTYLAGARYEFHPLNPRPPYLDNACTATHQL